MAYMSIASMVLRWAFSKPATRLYPIEKRASFPGTRGHIDIAIDACSFCTLCQKKCPTGAITVSRTEKYWELNRLQCIACGACVDPCPQKCLSMGAMYSPAVTAKNIDRFSPTAPANTAAPPPVRPPEPARPHPVP